MSGTLTAEEREMRKSRFLEAFASTGIVKEAADAANITRQTVMGWRQSDSEFEAAYLDCLEEANDVVRSHIQRRAFGYKVPLHYRGMLTGHEIEQYSDSMLALLARRLPEFREKHAIELSSDMGDVREMFLERLAIMAERMRQDDASHDGDASEA